MRDELLLELSPSAIKIRDAARALTQNRALAEVTIADVAHRSGVNEVTIYRIFGSRDGLAAACWSTNLPALHRGIRRDHAGLQDPIDRIKAHLRRLARIAVSDREITQSLILAVEAVAMGSSSAMGTLDPRELVPLPQILTPLIVDAQDAGLMRNDYSAFELAVFLTNSLLLRLLTRPDHSAATVSRFVIDLSLEGVLTGSR
ncbi:MAG: TetR/AcrR family transcriptional regulator [Actinomycetia bacterium]|nr:TetR/AcrR family transcriptional regulator [Actinomycetes bacterium]